MTEVTVHRIVAQPLSAQAFSPFGVYAAPPTRPPDWLASGSRVEGVSEGHAATGKEVARLWRLGDLSFAGDVPYVGFVTYQHQGFRVAQLERHVAETQTWLAQRGTSFIVVASPTDTGQDLRVADVAAFVVEPGDLVALHRAAWMCHFFPLGPSADYVVLTARREPEEDRDLVDLRAVAATVLEITLA